MASSIEQVGRKIRAKFSITVRTQLLSATSYTLPIRIERLINFKGQINYIGVSNYQKRISIHTQLVQKFIYSATPVPVKTWKLHKSLP